MRPSLMGIGCSPIPVGHWVPVAHAYWRRPTSLPTLAACSALLTRSVLPTSPAGAAPPWRLALSGVPLGDELAAVDLGRRAPWDAVDELDRLGHLVGGQPALGEGDHLSGGHWLQLVGRLHDGVDSAAPLLVLQPDDDHVGDAGVLAEGGLHLGLGDIGAAGDDHVDAAVGDVEEPLLVEPAEVTRRREAVVGHGQVAGGAEIAVAARERRAQVDLADLTGGEVLLVGPQHSDLRVADP